MTAPEDGRSEPGSSMSVAQAIRRASEMLDIQRRSDDSWEKEVIWSPIITAQFAIVANIVGGHRLLDARQDAVLKQFASSRLPDGSWGLSVMPGRSGRQPPRSCLFVTTLVYIAARLLGVSSDAPLLERSRAFIRSAGGAVRVPSWGKFWLAMLNLYDWSGVNPILPEAWLVPSKWKLTVHPGNLYCHTRLIYLAMAFIYGKKFQTAENAASLELRKEIFLQSFGDIRFNRTRCNVYEGDLYSPPSKRLRALYHLSSLCERLHSAPLRQRALDSIITHIRYDLQTTAYTAISPVSGLLYIVCLWLNDPNDPDLKRAIEGFSSWIWSDEDRGLTVSGARSATWDTSFALQALQQVRASGSHYPQVFPSEQFLASQQIRDPISDPGTFYRIPPEGGFCFARKWHGWPVSDCTAEAMLALIDSACFSREAATDAVAFILRCQNPDGGFGTYESRKTKSAQEWLNSSEMFSDATTEHSYVECTASCLTAICAFQRRYPDVLTDQTTAASKRATAWLLGQQRPDGSWPGAWGVNFIYGTMFGIRGLRVSSDSRHLAAVRRACTWLTHHQKCDGGWGECHTSCVLDRYVEHEHSQVVQTAWAMIGLIEGRGDLLSIERGATYLISMQQENGEWPDQDHMGVFFRTSLIQYQLYRSYFPLWALALYESRRQGNHKPIVAATAPRCEEP